ncbi:hypothetical protein LXA43DRAFT_1095858 [Ganoderma leucocontextum]|nr:hypothetical protein LXA43DRAFT_1095858 [Ganoderma leucocontextum]
MANTTPALPPPEAYLSHPFDIRHDPPGSIPATAFGFVLDDPFRRRWALDFLDKHYDPDGLERAAKSPEQNERTLSCAMLIMGSVIAAHVYRTVPDLLVFRRGLLPVKERGALIPRLYVFVLQDGGPRMTIPPTAEHVARVRKALGFVGDVDDPKPTWVSIDLENC